MNQSTSNGGFRPSPWMQEGKVEGGFTFIDSAAFANAWHNYQNGKLKLTDIRCWLAMHEMVERRKAGGERQKPTFADLELARLTGTPEARRSGGSRRRLMRHEAVQWTDSTVRFLRAASPSIGGRTRVPMPRRVLRHLARRGTAADIATAMGHAARCLYYQGETRRVRSGGTCKASWIASEFGIGERSVHRSRQKLMKLGWLKPVDDGLVGGRLGARFVIDLAWGRTGDGRKMAAQREPNDADLAAPTILHQPSSRIKKPELDSGVSTKPDLKNVVPADLKNPRRLEVLFEQAGEAGLVPRTEAGRLSVFAAAERAKRCGSKNPCGFFIAIVRRKLWHHLANQDEDRGRALRHSE